MTPDKIITASLELIIGKQTSNKTFFTLLDARKNIFISDWIYYSKNKESKKRENHYLKKNCIYKVLFTILSHL